MITSKQKTKMTKEVKMNTILEFKRAMLIGTFWEATHQYIGNTPSNLKSLGTRECALNNSVGFGFITESGSVSHSDWPRKSEFSFEGGTVTIEKEGFVRLTYKQVNYNG